MSCIHSFFYNKINFLKSCAFFSHSALYELDGPYHTVCTPRDQREMQSRKFHFYGEGQVVGGRSCPNRVVVQLLREVCPNHFRSHFKMQDLRFFFRLIRQKPFNPNQLLYTQNIFILFGIQKYGFLLVHQTFS